MRTEKKISQDDFWDAVFDDALRELDEAEEELVRIEPERDREGDLAGIPIAPDTWFSTEPSGQGRVGNVAIDILLEQRTSPRPTRNV